ncbi:hypothetical protein Vau01_118750 [Virgisporangium aurantiacum]|uniref:Uncharacterized protein n=1 Tax=Virgisporangium aurantiacum TaxID=175570 RepID=A0A8J4E7J2_9ACTN|nr:hypothetical protein Vau01_118750 [Virgisporangium aurantiacum]
MRDRRATGTTRPVDWSRFDTAVHRAAQANCRHVIACAVDAATRQAVAEDIDYARRVGDVRVLPLLIARLGGPSTLAPVQPSPDEPVGKNDTDGAARV